MENPGVKYGIIGGLASVILLLVLYLIDDNIMMRQGSMMSYVIWIIAMVLAGRLARDLNGGSIVYKTVLQPIFLSYVISTLISTIFLFALLKMDSNLVDIQRQIGLEYSESVTLWVADFFNMGAEQKEEILEEAMEEARNQDFTPRFGTQFLGYMVNLIIGFFIAAIIAFFLKRKGEAIA